MRDNDAAHAWLAADRGQVIFTADGGVHWKVAPVAGFTQYGDLSSIDFCTDNLTGWTTGVEKSWGGNTSRIARSTDGGRRSADARHGGLHLRAAPRDAARPRPPLRAQP